MDWTFIIWLTWHIPTMSAAIASAIIYYLYSNKPDEEAANRAGAIFTGGLLISFFYLLIPAIILFGPILFIMYHAIDYISDKVNKIRHRIREKKKNANTE